ncbi:hypothetical protein SYJ56_13520 [Algoriphagus sp. D3-2-R+10]|uniref:hypothetical protein n=1 Tax=Algoriphagus aurantiacus TaxID=3103948 RepID=UPI002B3BFDC6|nr:hypothetical protein [Algoriphagus sp. D3-2-R+10]MEB2776336.1 hypothetical protein [Algoriphagus sp. D3-2-R+10]
MEYGKSETKRAIGNVLQHVLKSYRYTSLPELNAVLKGYRILADRGTEESRIFKSRGLVYRVLDDQGNKVGVPIKASIFHFRATLNSIESRFESNELERKNHIKSIRSAIDLTLMKMSGKSLDDVIKSLEKKGIATVKRENQEGRLYGITFVDHRTKCVFNGSALGKNYSAKGLLDRIEKYKNNDGLALESVVKTSSMIREKQDMIPEKTIGSENRGVYSDTTLRGLLDTVITPEQEYNYVPFEWRKEKEKEVDKVNDKLVMYGNADRGKRAGITQDFGYDAVDGNWGFGIAFLLLLLYHIPGLGFGFGSD